MKIISLDAETNGLWGQPFSIGAVLYQDGQEMESFFARIPNEFVDVQWCIDNVLPVLEPVTHQTRNEMYQAFADWYNLHRKDATVLWHMGHVVEAFMFRELVGGGFIGEWDAPYTPIEVSEVLRMKGFDPSSVDTYAAQAGLKIPGKTHDPVFDSRVAAEVYFHLTN